ncbi:MAG: MutS-related protein [Flavipsychrobacter sp.]
MHNDKTTLKDLSIFGSDGGEGVFGLINHTHTLAGKEVLRQHIQHPPAKTESLQQMQDAVKFLSQHIDLWPASISNGTLVMLEKFYESADTVSAPPIGITRVLSAFFQKLLNKNAYQGAQFSISQLGDFFKGCQDLAKILEMEEVPELLKRELEQIQEELQHRLVAEILTTDKAAPYAVLARLAFEARRELKNKVYRLISHYARLDAWQSMATATIKNNWVFPEILPGKPIYFKVDGLYHPLLEQPVSYDIAFSEHRNFLLLTGANMSGKTTFMRAIGVSALLAHLGMGVPAKALSLSFLQGIITSMQVEDNLTKGESYFFAEVQRMKLTAQQLLQQEAHLVLMDELFKGTNVHDAYECTRAVVEGLLHRPNHLMILSTHLYEVAQHFKDIKKIQFAYFVTNMQPDGSYQFTYELREGISDDRIGYRILQKEGVLNLLKKKI